ncbi:hypothetical protein J2Z30_006043 [Streptomyces iranensis]|uniref:Uncharacterized protein n=1 Tax=Streptomyces iranensis TaxID=576784 RepID=A0ABS4MZ34_9ACTN|nr:hypothetical protein [Streptomyces iranensis]
MRVREVRDEVDGAVGVPLAALPDEQCGSVPAQLVVECGSGRADGAGVRVVVRHGLPLVSVVMATRYSIEFDASR